MDVLRKNWQFRHVYGLGKKIVCNTAIVFYLKNDKTAGGNRFGFVASKRVGNAVKRNRAKRLLREASRKIAEKLKTKDLWLVFVAKQAILEAKGEEVSTDLEDSLRKEGLLGKGK